MAESVRSFKIWLFGLVGVHGGAAGRFIPQTTLVGNIFIYHKLFLQTVSQQIVEELSHLTDWGQDVSLSLVYIAPINSRCIPSPSVDSGANSKTVIVIFAIHLIFLCVAITRPSLFVVRTRVAVDSRSIIHCFN